MSKPIACQLHDTIEVACMYRYKVRLILKDGSVIEGMATDVKSDSEKREFLLLTRPDCQLELIDIARMEVLSANPVFRVVEF